MLRTLKRLVKWLALKSSIILRPFIYRIVCEFNVVPRRKQDIEQMIRYLEEKVGIGCGDDATASGEVSVIRLVSFLPEMPAGGKRIIFDVGANAGQYSSMVLNTMTQACEIHCFEPAKSAYERLMQEMAGENNVVLNNYGLFSKDEERVLFMDSEGSGLSSLTKRRLQHFGIEHGKIREKVRLSTLSKYCHEKDIHHIDVLKIDVEGHEMDVLMGAGGCLENTSFIQFEFGGCAIDTRTFFQDFYYLFSKKDFSIYRILPDGCFLHLAEYREDYEKFRCMNYLCINPTINIPAQMKYCFVE
jgi:FkbM family methyltransferase